MTQESDRQRYDLPGGHYVMVFGQNLRPDMTSVYLFDPNDNHMHVHVPLLGDYKPADIIEAVQTKLAGMRKHMADLQKVVVAMGDPAAMQTENNIGQRRLAIKTEQDEDSPCPADFELIDKATTNHDVVATVPLTLDEEYDKTVVKPWAELFVKAPEMEACLRAVEVRLFAAAAEGVSAKEANELASMASAALGVVPF